MKQWWFLLVVFGVLSIPSAHAEYGLHAGTHFGFGNIGDRSNGLTGSRQIGTFDIQLMPGWRFLGKTVLTGLMFDFRFMSQLSQTTSGSLGGNGLLTGPGFAVDLIQYKFLFAWDWRARHASSDPGRSLKGSGIHILAGYRISGPLWGDIEYVRARYNGMEMNEVGSDLTSDPIVHTNVGFGISYSY